MNNQVSLQVEVNDAMSSTIMSFFDVNASDRVYAHACRDLFSWLSCWSIDEIENCVRVYRKCGGANNG